MKRDYKLYLKDIEDSIIQIELYIKDISEEVFKKDILIQDAVIRRLEIIGESSRNIPRSLKEKNKDIPWYEISQLRDFIVHSYFEVSLNRIWKTIKGSLPEIKEKHKKITYV